MTASCREERTGYTGMERVNYWERYIFLKFPQDASLIFSLKKENPRGLLRFEGFVVPFCSKGVLTSDFRGLC